MECPGIGIRLIRSDGESHDRFIVLDLGTGGERVFHCGSSSKDAGYRMTAIMEFSDDDVKTAFCARLDKMLQNPVLELK